ncbi:MAG TPA: hypothetical protein VHL79_16020 [Ramlibacter sp.]|jgi:hypothetical protein|nr:hypothetical protein [Ramlibacter sp.]
MVPRAVALAVLAAVSVHAQDVPVTGDTPAQQALDRVVQLRRAAWQGDAAAAFKLFDTYRSGAPGILRDEREASRWLQAAAHAGIVDAQVELAGALRHGRMGLVRAPARAYFWISLAAGKLHPDAARARTSYEDELTPNEVEQVHQQVRDWKPTPLKPELGLVPLPEVRIARTLEVVELTQDNFAATLRACIPTMPQQVAERYVDKWIPEPRRMGSYVHPGSGSIFAAQDTTGTCIRRSETGHPILPVEALRITIEPAGVPAEVLEQWFGAVALEIARKGYAEVVFRQSESGNAFVTLYKRAAAPLLIEYRTALRRPGEYDPTKYDMVFTHPGMTELNTRRYGRKQEKFVLQHRFAADPAPGPDWDVRVLPSQN